MKSDKEKRAERLFVKLEKKRIANDKFRKFNSNRRPKPYKREKSHETD